MANSVSDLQNLSLASAPGADVNQQNPLDCVVDQMIQKMKELEEKNISRFNYLGQCYVADKSKLGSKKFVVTQPEATKGWRQEMKGLLREYLSLKFSEQEEVSENELCEMRKREQQLASVFGRQDLGIFEVRFKIKTDHSSSWYRLPQLSDRVLILQNHEVKKVVSLSEKERLVFQKKFLARLFQGSHLEYIQHRSQAERQADSFWSGWKTYMGIASGPLSYLPQIAQRTIYNIGNLFAPISEPWSEYQQVIHPVMRDAACEILNNTETFQPNVVDVCGGEGDLAIQIAETYQKPMNYYLLEYNDLSLQRASSLLLSKNQENLGCIIPMKTDVTNHDDYFVDIAKKEPMQRGSVDLIIGCGALTEYVLENKESALAVARKCYELLKPQGKMILAGHAPSFLDGEDFSALGFHVINRFFIREQSRFSTDVRRRIWALQDWNKQFYILEKIESLQ